MAGEQFDDYVCGGCGMAYGDHGRDELAPRARTIAPRWRELVTGREEHVLARRPDEDTWSAKEYGWHLGSVLDWMATSVESMIDEDEPTIEWYGHEADVRDADPNGRDLDEVTTRIDRGSSRLAAVLASVDIDDWDRRAEFTWGRRDVMDMARNAVHEGEHHLADVERVLHAVAGDTG